MNRKEFLDGVRKHVEILKDNPGRDNIRIRTVETLISRALESNTIYCIFCNWSFNEDIYQSDLYKTQSLYYHKYWLKPLNNVFFQMIQVYCEVVYGD